MNRELLAKLATGLSDTADWLVLESGYNPVYEHEVESLLTIGNGYLGTRGSLEEGSATARPSTLVAGYFDPKEGKADVPALVIMPDWLHTVISLDANPLRPDKGELLEHERWLDMRHALVVRHWRWRDELGRITTIATLRFASLSDEHALGLRIVIKPENYSARLKITTGLDGNVVSRGRRKSEGSARLDELGARPIEGGGVVMEMITHDSRLRSAMASRLKVAEDSAPVTGKIESLWAPRYVAENLEFEALLGETYIFDKSVSIFTERDLADPAAAAIEHVAYLAGRGLTPHITEHTASWRERWQHADIVIEGDARTQQAVRFCIYHLLICANPRDERVSIGARTLSGPSYNGHVFWDTELFMLPLFTFVEPEAARAMLMYRYHTLAGARAKAARKGYRGALYSWESAVTGEETTPDFVHGPEGEKLPVYSGLQQHHISADIVYAIWQYWQVTRDEDFMLAAGAEIVLEVARFWASRAELGEEGYHIRTIMGPDEYHHSIDDNAYTNYLARWSIERAEESLEWLRARHPARRAELVAQLAITDTELRHWRKIAEGLVSGFSPDTKLFEQFRGFFGLEAVDLKQYEPRIAPMEVLLGQEPIRRTQVIKQPDIIMLLYLFPHAFSAEVQRINFNYYDPKCGHGSSLGPAICAAVAARIGNDERARYYLQQATTIDLENNMGNAAGGIHAAACGGLWQAVVFGFAGLSLAPDLINFDPHLPAEWQRLAFSLLWQGRRLDIEMTGRYVRVRVREGGEVTVAVRGEPVTLAAGREYEWQSVELVTTETQR